MTPARSTTRTAPPVPAFAAGIVLAGTLALSLAGAPGIPCLFRTLFHIECPGCGLTRSLKALWSGDLNMSFKYHPLGFPLFAACAAALGLAVMRRISPGWIPPVPLTRRTWLGVLAALLGAWAIRMADRFTGGDLFIR